MSIDPKVIEPAGYSLKAAAKRCGMHMGVIGCPICDQNFNNYGGMIVVECVKCNFQFPEDWWTVYSSGVNDGRRINAGGAELSGGMKVRMDNPYYRAGCRHLDQRVTGRPATPQEIHDLRGTEKRRKPKGRTYKSIDFPEHSVRPPEWFSLCELAGREWSRLVGQLSALDLWTPLDVAAVTIGCASFALSLMCCDRLKTDEQTAIEIGEGVAVKNPLLVIRSKHVELCNEVWKDYGMTPLDRVNFSRMDGRDDGAGDGPHRLAMFPDEVA